MKLSRNPAVLTWMAAACLNVFSLTVMSLADCLPAFAAEPNANPNANPNAELNSDRPVIGINLDVNADGSEYSLASRYVKAISKAGGIALVLPPMTTEELGQVLPKLDGMLMIGGDDYPPSSYGQKTESKTCIMAEARSQFDMQIVRSVLAQPLMPYLGICAGSQVLNIASGGELIQDIPTAKPDSKVSHSSKSGWQGKTAGSHVVTLKEGSKLAAIYAAAKDGGKAVPTAVSFAVPTSHHQCVSTLGKNLAVAATTDDGVTEAIEGPGSRFVVGVQWHPERDFEHNSVLFSELIKQAKRYRASKH
ncbi:hypothetical protein BH11CYA1_BH11CYA1_47820 [soil metagenome]